jgi:hypothetical protein
VSKVHENKQQRVVIKNLVWISILRRRPHGWANHDDGAVFVSN